MQTLSNNNTPNTCLIEPKIVMCKIVYKGENEKMVFEINFRELIHYVDYFYENQFRYYEGCEIELLDPNSCYRLNIIEIFIQYCQNKPISICDDNVIQLQSLADQFNITSLKKQAQNYIDNNPNIIYQLITKPDVINHDIESSIASNLFQFIDKKELKQLPVATLDRILKKYNESTYNQQNDTNNDNTTTFNDDEQKIFDFLFNCLDYHGVNASCFFSIFDFLFKNKDCLNKLLSQYANIFNLAFLPPKVIKISCQAYVDTDMSKASPSNDENRLKIKEGTIEENQIDDEMTLKIKEGTNEIKENEYIVCDPYSLIIIPESVEKIGRNAFKNSNTLLNVVIFGSNLKIICENAFYGCQNLESITIPESLELIDKNAFYGCVKLKVKGFAPNAEIRDSAFCYCQSLDSFNLPNVATNISYQTFFDCSSLQDIIIPDSVTEICANAFHTCSSLREIVIPNSVLEIGNYAFYYCRSLQKVIISNSVLKIGKSVFQKCSSLVTVEMGNSVKSIGSYAFFECPLLKEISIPNSVIELGDFSFESHGIKVTRM